MILHTIHASAESTTTVIIVRSPDTDVIAPYLHHADLVTKYLLFDIWTGNKIKLLNIKTISTLLGFLVLTVSDSTSLPVAKQVSEVLEKCPEILVTCGTLGNSTHVNDELLSGLEGFVCDMFGEKSADIPKSGMRLQIKVSCKVTCKLSSGDGADLSLLLPCWAPLKMQTTRHLPEN